MECFYSELHQLKTRASDSPPDLMEYDTKKLALKNIFCMNSWKHKKISSVHFFLNCLSEVYDDELNMKFSILILFSYIFVRP